MSGIGDAFRPFGKEYDAHTPAVSCASCATLRAQRDAAREVLQEVKALYESGAFDERHTGTCVVCNQGAPHFQHCGLGKVLDKIERELETP